MTICFSACGSSSWRSWYVLREHARPDDINRQYQGARVGGHAGARAGVRVDRSPQLSRNVLNGRRKPTRDGKTVSIKGQPASSTTQSHSRDTGLQLNCINEFRVPSHKLRGLEHSTRSVSGQMV